MVHQVITFPDIEEGIRAHLAAELSLYGSNATAHCAVPNPRPDNGQYVVVRRLGGPRRDIVTDDATITFECSALTDVAASELADLVRGLVFALRGVTTATGMKVYTVGEIAGPAPLPDLVTNLPRYVLTDSIAVRGSVRDKEE